jgi:beta-xylosidase
LHLIWKEDANSVKKPTPIWIMEMNEERTKLIGEKKELFRNNLDWEQNLVEGVSMIKHGGYYYALYAAAGCCGAGCTYVVGVARAKKLLGPWEKDPQNPVLKNNGKWICPGHGTAIEKDGKYYFLHHAYDKKTSVFTGRQGILSEFKFTPDGWVEFINNPVAVTKPAPVEDNFEGHNLALGWEWSVFSNINYQLKGGNLQLGALPEAAGAFIGRKTLTGNYTSTTTVDTKQTNATAGLAAIGDEKNVLSILFAKNKIKVVALKNGVDSTIAQNSVSAKTKIYLKMQVSEGRYFTYSYSTNGKNYTVLNKKPADGIYLPPWDRGIRAGLISKGNPNQKAVFESFRMISN